MPLRTAAIEPLGTEVSHLRVPSFHDPRSNLGCPVVHCCMRHDGQVRSRAGQRAPRAVWMLLTLALAAPAASGQTDRELSRARAMFQQAIELEQAGNCSAAVQLFREVGQVRMTPQVRFHIAVCEDKLGKLVAALGGYELALADAASVGPEFRSEVEANVRRLRARIPKLIIRRGAGADAAVIALDGVSLGDNSLGVEVPLDPGPHALSAEAPGFKAFEATIPFSEGELKTVEVVLEPLPREAVFSTPGGSAPLAKSPSRLVPLVVGGVGAASLLTSGVLLAFRQTSSRKLDDACEGEVCPLSQRDEYDRLKAYHYGSLVTVGVGVGALGGAALVWVLQDNRMRKERSAWHFQPSFTRTSAVARVRVRF